MADLGFQNLIDKRNPQVLARALFALLSDPDAQGVSLIVWKDGTITAKEQVK